MSTINQAFDAAPSVYSADLIDEPAFVQRTMYVNNDQNSAVEQMKIYVQEGSVRHVTPVDSYDAPDVGYYGGDGDDICGSWPPPTPNNPKGHCCGIRDSQDPSRGYGNVNGSYQNCPGTVSWGFFAVAHIEDFLDKIRIYFVQIVVEGNCISEIRSLADPDEQQILDIPKLAFTTCGGQPKYTLDGDPDNWNIDCLLQTRPTGWMWDPPPP